MSTLFYRMLLKLPNPISYEIHNLVSHGPKDYWTLMYYRAKNAWLDLRSKISL